MTSCSLLGVMGFYLAAERRRSWFGTPNGTKQYKWGSIALRARNRKALTWDLFFDNEHEHHFTEHEHEGIVKT